MFFVYYRYKERKVMKELFLLRGLPGSGKSTIAKSLNGVHIEADQYFMWDGEYRFDVSRLKDAHNYCKAHTQMWMMSTDNEQVNTDRIIVSNTFTQEWEMQPYFDLATEHGYRVYCLVVENRHNGINSHNVPYEKLEQMKNRFELKLI